MDNLNNRDNTGRLKETGDYTKYKNAKRALLQGAVFIPIAIILIIVGFAFCDSEHTGAQMVFLVFSIPIGIYGMIKQWKIYKQYREQYRPLEEKLKKEAQPSSFDLSDELKKTKKKLFTIFIIIIIAGILLSLALSSSSGKHSSPSKKNYDDYYDDYDYDNDGNINQGEWEDALGDYMDDVMGY